MFFLNSIIIFILIILIYIYILDYVILLLFSLYNTKYNYVYFWEQYQHFILARKVVKNFKNGYQDIFTKTFYENDPLTIYEVGKVYVRLSLPIISNLSFISKAQASSILTNKNYVVLDSTNPIVYSEDNGFFNFENKSSIKKLIKK